MGSVKTSSTSTSTSPPTDRVLDVLELLAEQPGRSRLADLTRALGITKGTAHAILSTLCDRGWVWRDPIGRTFSLGPALGITAGKADTVRPLALAARAAAVHLAGEFGHAVSVVERVADSIVVVAFEVGAGDGHVHASPGDRVPFGAPLGLGFAAWESPDVQRRWIERGTGEEPALVQQLEDLIDETRHRGYTVERMSPTYVQTAQLMATLRNDDLPHPVRRAVDAMLADLTTIVLQPDHTSEAVTSLATPIFDPRGQVVLNLAVHPSRPVSPRQIEAIGPQLLRRATEATQRASESAVAS